jgi:hypothetical protein
MEIPGVVIKTVDYKDRKYDRFYVARDPGFGPGWYVFGRNPEYGDHLVMNCARPDVKPRSHPHYNQRVQRGWLYKRDAQAIADQMNALSKE